ncbi:MAG TPA: TolC family protein [Candidatus Eisenbacteria bacterium]|nr:TolC family protein [Candidatus Eisenbacteria bacterium]
MKKSKTELERFSREVIGAMPFLLREFAKREDNELSRGKISCPQMLALDYVSRHPRVRMTDIAQVLDVRTSSASVLVDRLIREKMLTRAHDDRDRRVVWVGATAKGRKVVSQILEQKRRSVKAVFGPLTARERAQYLAVLLKVKSILGRASAAALLLALVSQPPAHAFFWNKKKPEPVRTVVAPSPASSPLTLDEAFSLALKRSETLASEAEDLSLAQARFYRSFRYFLPDVDFLMTRTERDVNSGGGSSGDGISSDSRRRYTPENKFTFSQPIFSGFKEIAALRATGADKSQQRLEYRRAEELLFVDVMEAFYAVSQAEADAHTLEATKKLLEDRMKELSERIGLGRSRETEGKTAEADLKLAEADLVIAKTAVDTARNLLEFYLGQPLAGRPLEEGSFGGQSAGLDFYLDQSRLRSDVRAAEEALRVARAGLLGAQGGFLPTVSLDGNYYTKRVGFQNGNDWDVTFAVDVPIFDAGETLADVKEAGVTLRRAELTLSRAQRTAELEVRNAWEEMRSAKAAESAFAEAARAAKENYEILSKEYRLSLVNNIEVLDALRRNEEIQRRANDARYDARRAFWKFRVALGDLPVPETSR